METGDPYSVFLSSQKKREKECKANRREAKKQKLDSSTPPGPPGLSDAASEGHQDSITELRKQLDAKTEECSRMKNKLESAEEALKTQQCLQESVLQVKVSVKHVDIVAVFSSLLFIVEIIFIGCSLQSTLKF